MSTTVEPSPNVVPSDGTQESIRLSLPLVEQNVDYSRMSTLLDTIDEILRTSGTEDRFIQLMLADEVSRNKGQSLSNRRHGTVVKHARRSLRCMTAQILSGESFRTFSVHLADSYLLRRFCHYDELGDDRSPSKSTLGRMADLVDESELSQVIAQLITSACSDHPSESSQQSPIGLEAPLDLDVVLADATCLELDMHFPVDWVLLRDGVKSIIQSIILIRKHGLVHRMKSPQVFIKEINALCISMSAATRQRKGKKARKATLRKMKSLAKTVVEHGLRYVNLLENHGEETDLSPKQQQLIASRLQKTIDLMPQAISQAHQRIITEQKVANDQKLLSLFQTHASVYVRKKSGSDCEFGLQCLIVENSDGLILDWSVSDDGVQSDSKLLIPAMDRLRDQYGTSSIKGVVTDRGFSSPKNTKELGGRSIKDYTLPRSPAAMKNAMKDADFAAHQHRRSQTEARIGILKNNFIGQKIRAKGLDNQKTHIAWAALAHNVWLLARMLIDQRESQKQEAAA